MASPNPLRRSCKECKASPLMPCIEDGKFLSECHEVRRAPSREPQRKTHMTVHHRVHLAKEVK